MSELQPHFENREHSSADKDKSSKEHAKRLHEQLEKAAERAEEDKLSIEKIRESIEKVAASKHEFKDKQRETNASESPLRAAANFKGHISKRTIKQVQKQLPPRDRAFSKVIHQPAIEAFSNAAEDTIASPSGLLVGGIFSVIGSLVALYICRHYGYEYNFLIGIACFVSGFLAGLLLQGLIRLLAKLKA